MNTETHNRPAITMAPVKSSQIAAIGHDEETNTLAIEFPAKKDGSQGSVYHYSNFDAESFKAFRDAESIGSYFIKHIKPHADKHPYVKMPRMEVANSKSIKARVIKQISEITTLSVESIKPESTLESDLQCDSLDTLEIVMMLEQEFGVEIDDNKAMEFKTVQDVIDYVSGLKVETN